MADAPIEVAERENDGQYHGDTRKCEPKLLVR